MAKRKKILLAIISNRKYYPAYFVRSVFAIANHTRQFHDLDIQTFESVEVQQMRNNACHFAIHHKYDYLFMLDDDMNYPQKCIVELMKHKKEFVVGSATQRRPPFYPTQYKNLNAKRFKDKVNRVFITKEDKKLIEVDGSGVVGALIKVDSLKKLKAPYFRLVWKKNGFDIIGSDVYFCKEWRKTGKKIYLDPKINYDHEITAFSNSFGIVT